MRLWFGCFLFIVVSHIDIIACDYHRFCPQGQFFELQASLSVYIQVDLGRSHIGPCQVTRCTEMGGLLLKTAGGDQIPPVSPEICS